MTNSDVTGVSYSETLQSWPPVYPTILGHTSGPRNNQIKYNANTNRKPQDIRLYKHGWRIKFQGNGISATRNQSCDAWKSKKYSFMVTNQNHCMVIWTIYGALNLPPRGNLKDRCWKISNKVKIYLIFKNYQQYPPSMQPPTWRRHYHKHPKHTQRFFFAQN